ncbi:MAG: RNA polymerase sigma factor [Hyphomicrobiaceae bacterium]
MTPDYKREMVALLPRLRRFGYALTNSMDDADDLVQVACERALSRFEQFEPGTRLDSWMFRIMQTTWIDEMRRVKRRNTVVDPAALEAVRSDDRIEERAGARRDLEIVRDEIARLPEEQRVLLSLVTIEGLSYQDAASALGIPIGTAMSRLFRARKKLAQALENLPRSGDLAHGRPR